MPTLLVFRLLTQPGPERPLSSYLANGPVPQSEQPGLGPVLPERTVQRGQTWEGGVVGQRPSMTRGLSLMVE